MENPGTQQILKQMLEEKSELIKRQQQIIKQQNEIILGLGGVSQLNKETELDKLKETVKSLREDLAKALQKRKRRDHNIIIYN